MNKNNFEDINEDKIEILKQTQAESQRILIGTLKPKRNHILFELDFNTREMRRAEFTKDTVVSFEDAMAGQISVNKQINIKPGCYYVSAMNEENAWKKIKRELS